MQLSIYLFLILHQIRILKILKVLIINIIKMSYFHFFSYRQKEAPTSRTEPQNI